MTAEKCSPKTHRIAQRLYKRFYEAFDHPYLKLDSTEFPPFVIDELCEELRGKKRRWKKGR